MKAFFKTVISRILAYEARILLARKKPKIIAVTGNVGKTSTKDAIYTVIRTHVRTRKSEKSYNSDIGVPLTILGLPNAWSSPTRWFITIIEGLLIALFAREYPEWLVLEMGVDRPGEMKSLARLAPPDIVVLTRFPDVPVHVEYFKTAQAVIDEKMELVHALKAEGVVIFNNDDENIRNALQGAFFQSIGFGKSMQSPFMVTAPKIVYKENIPVGCEFKLSHGQDVADVLISGSLGMHSAYSSVAAAAVGSVLGVSLQSAAESLVDHETPPGRMRLIRGRGDTLIIDDTYNASPLAMEQAVETLSHVTGAKRRIAVLGDMLELGLFSIKEHEKLGRFLVAKVDAVMTVGVRAHGIATALREAGMKASRIIEHGDTLEAVAELEELVKPGDVILVKGSQGVRMERIVKALMAEPERAGELLVRQDSMWSS